MSTSDPTQSPSEEAWQYHLPEFVDQLEQEAELDLREHAPGPFEGFLYHHRGVRVPAHEAKIEWTAEGFELRLAAVDGSTWSASFDREFDWDAYLLKLEHDEPALVWMTDAEFDEEEAAEHAAKEQAIARGRFSFGLYFESERTWKNLVEGLGSKQQALLFLRPSGRTYVPPDGFDLDHEIVPEELRPNDEGAPEHLGLGALRREGSPVDG